MENNVIRKAFRFTGWVQGVGFRWRAKNAAEHFGVTGWVRNEYDGSVRMELQGAEEQIDGVILAVSAGRYVQIEDMRVRTVPAVEHERGFTVRDDG
ncbi:MAG: acylphosphatase [Clostridia bacterium]|nr:acylphosphatase [Clostridia bacterium]MBR0510354.1 acylphosphatase [Clostridia bacterium]MBR0537256.1 acylphosphatase [Clostridia bacterium]